MLHKGEKCGIAIGGVKLQKAEVFPVFSLSCAVGHLSQRHTQLTGLQVRNTKDWKLYRVIVSI